MLWSSTIKTLKGFVAQTQAVKENFIDKSDFYVPVDMEEVGLSNAMAEMARLSS